MPISSPPSTRSRSAWERPSIASRSLESAGLPASSPMMCPSAAVTVSSGPIGAGPSATHGSPPTPARPTPLEPVEPHADRAAVDDLLAEEQRRPALAGPRRGHTAEQREQGRRVGEEAQ